MSLYPGGYPDGYADPPYDGTVEGWREVVLPARQAAIKVTFDAMLADMGFPDMHWEWAAPGEDAPVADSPLP